jgi:hypothetical protein
MLWLLPKFKYFSGILIHLESGCCELGVTEEDVDGRAHKCFYSKKYIQNDLEDWGWRYVCPSCEKDFLNLLALYQHAEDLLHYSYLVKGRGCLAKLNVSLLQSTVNHGPIHSFPLCRL